MSFFNSFIQPVGYGAIMYNGNSTGISSCYPFFTSRNNLAALTSTSSSGAGTISVADVDEYWTVMPGYKILVYTDTWYGGALLLTADNTSGVIPVNYTIPSPNNASSVKLYFNGTLIEDPTLTVTLFNGSVVAASNYATTYDIAAGSTYYHVYEFYAGSTGTISFTGSSTVSNIQALLIGGGGGGGNYFNGNTGSGGGGAGTFAHATFTAIPGATYTVNVGAGGSGGGANSNNPGAVGSPTSITRTYNGVIDASLNAGGGGGGGSANQPKGTNAVTYYGSTGGGYGTSSTTAGTRVWGTFTTDSIISYANVGGSGVGSGTGGGGGGGASAVGGNGAYLNSGGAGGAGRAWTVIPARSFAGGGGGMNSTNGGSAGGGGAGGGGAGYASATANTGSGGGAGYAGTAGGSGGSGICIIAIPV